MDDYVVNVWYAYSTKFQAPSLIFANDDFLPTVTVRSMQNQNSGWYFAYREGPLTSQQGLVIDWL